MPLNLQQAPVRLRKVLYRSDHFWLNTRSASTLPRYSAVAYADDVARLAASNEEAAFSLSVEGHSPYRDVYVGSATSDVYINGEAYLVDYSDVNNLVVPAGDSSSYTVTDIPLWYSNAIEKASTKFLAYKTLWAPSYRATSGSTQVSEMREPVGLSMLMKYYNKVSVYRKKVRITFIPRQVNRLRALTSGTPLQGLAPAGTGSNDNYDAPIMNKTWSEMQSNSLLPFGQPDMKFVTGAYEASTAQYQEMTPWWIAGLKYPIPIKQSKEGLKIGLMNRTTTNPKPIVMEYTTSPISVYGQKFDMSENYWSIDASTWTKHGQPECFINYFLFTMQNSPDSGFIPFIEGQFRIESWTDCVFWDRKDVSVSFSLFTEAAGTDAVPATDDDEKLELEDED